MKAAIVCAIALAAAPAAQSAPTFGLVGSGAKTRLVQVDPRTLQPLDTGLPIRAGVQWAARSPDGRRVALATSRGILIADPTRHTIQGNDSADTSQGLVWPASIAGEPILVAIGSSGYGYEYTAIDPFYGDGTEDTDAAPYAVLRAGLVTSEYDPRSLFLVRSPYGDKEIDLPNMPEESFALAADVPGDRLFVITTSGVVGEVDHVDGNPQVSYHAVKLSGRPFKVAWAGDGRIALWGADGLGSIDTRDWSTHAIAAGITDATPTSYGLVAWSKSGAGLALYRPSGELRFRALTDRAVTDLQTGDRFAYVTTSSGRFSIDLTTGLVTGPLTSRARLLPRSYNPNP